MSVELLPPSRLEAVAQRFRLLGEPTRLHLLNLLHVHGEMNVQDLCAAAGQSQANASKHLRLLLEEGLVARRQEGAFAYYSIADPMLGALCLLVCGSLDRVAPAGAGAERGEDPPEAVSAARVL